MILKLFISSCIFCGSALLAGCSQYYYDLGAPLGAEQVPNLEQRWLLGDVLRELGPPQRISALPTAYVMAWEHWEIDETNIGFSLGFAGADAMSIDWGKAKTRGEFLLLVFDEDHQLINSAFTEWDNDVGGGQAIQPLGSMMSVVDVDDLIRRMPQHRWGAALLAELPVSLNADSEPDSGQNGIEQRGTPTGVGQRTLEMD